VVTNLFVSLPLLTKEGALNFFPMGRALKLLCFRTDFNNIACSYESNSPIVLPSSSLPSAFLKSINLLNTGGMFNLKKVHRYRNSFPRPLSGVFNKYSSSG
jgi:hypothetical protein